MVASAWSMRASIAAAQQGVVLVEPAGHARRCSCGDLGAHPALGHLGQHFRVALTGDERVDHLPPRLRQHAGGHR